VIHRDIKPTNVLIDRQGDSFLTDFGIAKLAEHTMGFTGSSIIGTPQYMSPEQGQGLDIDGRSDIYSLGVVLYEMLTGRLPFIGDTPIAVVLQHVTAPLPPARSIAPHLPESIDTVLQTALAKQPADRYQAAGELAGAFDHALQTGVRPETQPFGAGQTPTQPSDSVRPTVATRKPIAMPGPARSALLVVAAAIVLVGLLAVLIAGQPAPIERNPSVGVTVAANIVTLTPASSPAAVASPTPPTSVAAPAANGGCDQVLFDDFHSESSGFPRGESDTASWGYVEGEYRILMKVANQFETRTLRQEFTDYSVEVDARFASQSPGNYGLIFSADAAATSDYAFVVDNARNFAVTRRVQNTAAIVRDWMFAPSLNTGGDANRLRAVHKGEALAVYANGVLLAVFSDTLKLPASRLGLTAASFGSGSVDARFDNFRVCRAPESLAPTDVSLVDTFDDDRNRWGAVRYANGLSAFIEDGGFQLIVPYQDPRYALFHWNPSFATGDFELEVESRIAEGTDGSRAGIMFGVQNLANSFILYASADGRLTLYNRAEGSNLPIVLDQPADAIQKGDGVNQWKIVVSEGSLTAGINGQPVLKASIAYAAGAIGFACEPGGPLLARCTFDNLSVHGKPSAGEVVVYPFCNCRREVRAGQPARVSFTWPAADAERVDKFLQSTSMTVTLDAKPIGTPAQYWGKVESNKDGSQARWLYTLPKLDPGSHLLQVIIASDIQLTDGRDANGDGRPDTYGPGELLKGYVQLVVSP
jgi:hypothetical protein